MGNPVSFNSSTITDLVTQLSTKPIQRSNRFYISFTGLANTITADIDKPFIASMVQIPSRTILYFPDTAGPFEPPFRVPLQHQYDDKLIVEFLVDEEHRIRKFIETWMDNIRMPKNSQYLGSTLYDAKEKCIATMTIQPQKSDNTGQSATYTLYDVWPKLILPSEMSSDTPDFLKLIVDFSYRYYTIA
jgi:hypothetical protein